MPQGITIEIEQYLLSFRNGEEEGFTFIFNHYFPALSVYAFGFTNDQETANDFVQEAFLNLWKRRKSFDRFYNIKAYLYRSVHNIAVSAMRKQKATDEKIFAMPVVDTLSQTCFDNIVKAELYAEIYRLIETLPQGTAEVIRLFYFEEKDSWEIADVLNIPYNTVRSRRASGLAQLRRLLPGYFRIVPFLVAIPIFF